MQFKVENYSSCYEEALPLLEDYWHEAELFSKEKELNPNHNYYLQLEQTDMVAVFTVRVEERLVGFAVVVSSPAVESTGAYDGVIDLVYIHPDFRKGAAGLKLMRYIEDVLTGLNFRSLKAGSSTKKDISVLLERRGFSPIETIFEKMLGN